MLDNTLSRTRSADLALAPLRLKTVADADLLIVLKDGYVAEQGTHSQLMAKEDGLYRSMWDQQNEMIHEQLEELEEADEAAGVDETPTPRR